MFLQIIDIDGCVYGLDFGYRCVSFILIFGLPVLQKVHKPLSLHRLLQLHGINSASAVSLSLINDHCSALFSKAQDKNTCRQEY